MIINRSGRINISVKTVELFQVITPQLIGDELLDAVVMNAKAEELVRSGNPYIAIDLSTLDYIYSDAINRFIQLNKILLDIQGRVIIIAPHPKVNELLTRAGIHKVIKIINNEAELKGLSAALVQMQQGTTPQIQEPTQAPLAESFEQFKDELATGLENIAPQTPQPQAPPVVPPSQPQAPLSTAESDEDRLVSELRESFKETQINTPIEEEEKENISRKGAPIAIIFGVLFLILLGAGTFLFLHSNEPQQQSEATPPIEEQPTAQEKTPTPKKSQPKKRTTRKSTTSSTKRTSSKKSSKTTPAKSTSQATTPASTKTANEAPAKEATQAPKSNDRVIVTSTPSGASVTIDGMQLGTTPYTWDSPSTFTELLVVLKKSGYKTASRRIDYNDGVEKVHLTLTKAPQKEFEEVAPVTTKPTPSKKPAPAPVLDEPTFEDDIEPIATPAPKPKPAPVAPTSGPTAEVFITSIPPMADVYSKGKLVGKTNAAPLKLSPGTHTLQFKKGAKSATKTVKLRPGKNSSMLIRLQ